MSYEQIMLQGNKKDRALFYPFEPMEMERDYTDIFGRMDFNDLWKEEFEREIKFILKDVDYFENISSNLDKLKPYLENLNSSDQR